MLVSIFQDEIIVGTATLEHLDPPMGVAFGPFAPSEHYDRDKHANTIEGDYVDDKGKSLSVRADQHGPLLEASIAIEDWADPKFGIQLTLFFRDGRDFAALFGTHNDYEAYYARGTVSARMWWRRKRRAYNVTLLASGFGSFVLYVLVAALCEDRLPEDFEITIFTIAFQAIGFLVAMGIANLFYFAGPISELIFQPTRVDRFRSWVFRLGSGFSIALIFAPPVTLAIVCLS